MSAFQKCCRDFSRRCLKFMKNLEKRVVCSGNVKILHSYLNKKLKATHAVNMLVDSDGGAVTDDAAKAGLFASFFSSVFR